jgi:hypothetical protein
MTELVKLKDHIAGGGDNCMVNFLLRFGNNGWRHALRHVKASVHEHISCSEFQRLTCVINSPSRRSMAIE